MTAAFSFAFDFPNIYIRKTHLTCIFQFYLGTEPADFWARLFPFYLGLWIFGFLDFWIFSFWNPDAMFYLQIHYKPNDKTSQGEFRGLILYNYDFRLKEWEMKYYKEY